MDLMNAVSVLGFPIVMCGALGWFVKYQCDNYRKDIEKITEVVQKNTDIMHKLLIKLGGDVDED